MAYSGGSVVGEDNSSECYFSHRVTTFPIRIGNGIVYNLPL